MKVSVLIVFVACVIYTVWCESCTTNTDCVSTACGNGTSLICQHPDGDGIIADNGLCTCEDSTGGDCVFASDCHGDNAPNLNCDDSFRHCYDGGCICDRFPGGKRAVLP